MRRTMLKSKIHRATVTEADVAYEGSVTLDAALLEAADILEHESVEIWDVTNGARLRTYAIAGERGSGVVCVNGAAARHVSPGDIVIVASFAEYAEEELRAYRPRLVFVDDANRPTAPREEVAGPARPLSS